MIDRREMLLSAAGGLAAAMAGPAARLWAAAAATTQLGLAVYCLGIRARAEREAGNPDFNDPLKLLAFARGLGAGGIQAPLGIRDADYCAKLRENARAWGMFVEAIFELPWKQADLERFEAHVRTARGAGASLARVVMMPGRRYERFHRLDEFREFAARGLRALERAEPIAARHKLHLALENHKDQRIDQRLAVLKHLDSEYVGACVDTGNSFVLMEDPVEVVQAYAPWARTVHLKDQAVEEYEDGFLFGDTALGDGFLDLPRMVRILRKANPQVRFNLEVITRDPLRVPCLTDDYWVTFADVPGRDLARTLRIVRANARKGLPRISDLPREEQVKREDENVRRGLAYARTRLGI